MAVKRQRPAKEQFWERNIRVVEFEEDNEEERRKHAFSLAAWVIFDYRNEKNIPIVDFLKITDPKGPQITVCQLNVDEHKKIWASRLFPQYDVKVNGKSVIPLEEVEMQLGDQLEVLGDRYLVHNLGDIPAEDAKRLKGLELVNKTVLGLKNMLTQKEEVLATLINEIEVNESVVADFKEQIETKNRLKKELHEIIAERKKLKAIFLEKRAEFDVLYALPLEENLSHNEMELSTKFAIKNNLQKEIVKLTNDIERRQKQLEEHNSMKRSMIAAKAKMEKEELLKRIQELEKLENGVLAGGGADDEAGEAEVPPNLNASMEEFTGEREISMKLEEDDLSLDDDSETES